MVSCKLIEKNESGAEGRGRESRILGAQEGRGGCTRIVCFGKKGTANGRFQNPWDSGAPSFGGDANAVEISSGGSNYMLESAPLPPPVTKASAQATNEQNDGMDVDMGIAA